MGQEIPQNYGKLVFGLPLSTREDFDPSSESIHGLLLGSSNQKEAPQEEDEPMNDSNTRPSRHITARGSSQQREEPGRNWWEDHRSSPGSPGSRIDLPPEEVGLDAEEEQEPYFEAEDHVQEEAAAFWVTEDQLEDDYLSD